VHQHFMLIPVFTVGENIVLGREPVENGDFYDRAEVDKRIRTLSGQYSLLIDPAARTGDLPVGLQQRVEILKVLYRGADILILDEPTGVLTPQETHDLFAVLRGLVRTGKTIIFITHKLKEVLEISDQVTVLRRGKIIGTVRTRDTNEEEIARMMVGREVLLRVDKAPATPGAAALRVEHLTVNSYSGAAAVRDVSLEVGKGEIVALLGANGAGKSTLSKVISGHHAPDSGEIMFQGQPLRLRSTREALDAGIAIVMQETSLVPDLTVVENIFLPELGRPGRLSYSKLRSRATELLASLGQEHAVPLDTEVRRLSAAQRQLVEIAKALGLQAKLIIFDEPTASLSPGEVERLFEIMGRLRADGRGLVFVSHRLEEVFEITDRVTILREGKTVAASREVASLGQAELIRHLHEELADLHAQLASKDIPPPARPSDEERCLIILASGVNLRRGASEPPVWTWNFASFEDSAVNPLVSRGYAKFRADGASGTYVTITDDGRKACKERFG